MNIGRCCVVADVPLKTSRGPRSASAFLQARHRSSTSLVARCLNEQSSVDTGSWDTPAGIGAEYGEGFVSYKIRGDVDKVDVDKLNFMMKTQGAQRLRHAMKPDEAIGVIFSFEGVLGDTRAVKEQAWRRVAADEGLHFPDIPRPQMYELPPERVVTEVLMWTSSWVEARKLTRLVSEAYVELFAELAVPEEGALEWLAALASSKVPCAVISDMSRPSLRKVLNEMGLDSYFQSDVTFEDDMETIAQKLLSASMKLGRPPNQCVAFASSPKDVAAAHNCTMKAVAVHGDFKGYQLKQADLTCSTLNELSVYNLRRLFANRGWEFMDTIKEKDSSGGGIGQTRIAAGTV
ncbi:hypothetical protein BSKO_00436 [Bryopsis sp. KO-2023]|nr:hypothetical protein BSKO_00436 [Bryopsis sp. KO-2023]